MAGDAANVNRSPSPCRGVRGVTNDGSKNAAAAVTLKTGYGLSTLKKKSINDGNWSNQW
jgi:hypothetical protein